MVKNAFFLETIDFLEDYPIKRPDPPYPVWSEIRKSFKTAKQANDLNGLFQNLLTLHEKLKLERSIALLDREVKTAAAFWLDESPAVIRQFLDRHAPEDLAKAYFLVEQYHYLHDQISPAHYPYQNESISLYLDTSREALAQNNLEVASYISLQAAVKAMKILRYDGCRKRPEVDKLFENTIHFMINIAKTAKDAGKNMLAESCLDCAFACTFYGTEPFNDVFKARQTILRAIKDPEDHPQVIGRRLGEKVAQYKPG